DTPSGLVLVRSGQWIVKDKRDKYNQPTLGHVESNFPRHGWSPLRSRESSRQTIYVRVRQRQVAWVSLTGSVNSQAEGPSRAGTSRNFGCQTGAIHTFCSAEKPGFPGVFARSHKANALAIRARVSGIP